MNADRARVVPALAKLINNEPIGGGGSIDALIKLGTYWNEFFSKLDIVGRAV